MENSLKYLAEKSKYSANAKLALNKRLSNLTDTGLVSLGNKKIVYELTDNMSESISIIKEYINKVNKSDASEVVLIDSFHSATIEGARTTVENVRKAYSNKNRTKSDVMVLNSIKATNIALQNGINSGNIRSVWEVLVENVCDNINIAGIKYRSGEVYIGSADRIEHRACEVGKIDNYMNILFKYSSGDMDLIKSCIIHFYFVYIHPFCDGNGRLARLWHKVNLCKIHDNFKYITISKAIQNNIGDYYKTIKDSEFEYKNIMDITTFIEYMLDCIASEVYRAHYNNVNYTDTDKYILGIINRDGVTVQKLVNKNMTREKVYRSLKKLYDLGILDRVKEENKYRYFKK